MVAILPCAVVTLALLQTGAPPPPSPEAAVTVTLEELRKGELLLDAEALAPYIAASFTEVEAHGRISGSFAYLEPIRRLRERGAEVKELRFDQGLIHVYGGSAIATYHYRKAWTEAGTVHREEGWSSDVFELRQDHAWILIHRHRGK